MKRSDYYDNLLLIYDRIVTFWVQTVQWIERRDFAAIFLIFSKPHRDFADFLP